MTQAGVGVYLRALERLDKFVWTGYLEFYMSKFIPHDPSSFSIFL